MAAPFSRLLHILDGFNLQVREKRRKQIFAEDCTPEIRNITILDIVNRCATSTRLKNCIASANKAGELPFNTISDFLEAGEHAKEKLLGVRNLGEKTVSELITIINIVIKTGFPKPDCPPEIRNITILDIVNRCNISVRLKNCIVSAAKAEELPFNTINGFLEAGKHAKEKLLGVRNLGEKTVNELITIIKIIIETGFPKPERHVKPKDYPSKIRNIAILDIVNRCNTSVRLKNCIVSAAKAEELPFNTIHDFLEAGEHAKRKLMGIRNMGEGTVNELIETINTVIATGLPEHKKYIKSDDLINFLDSEYPGVFQPLIDEYMSTPERELLKLSDLEKVLQTLCKKPKHAKMVWRRFSGETLASIGKSFSLTKERVRQIIKRYGKYTTDVNSPSWVEKSIRHLISRTSDENRLPDNKMIDKHHPKLATLLVENFSDKKSGNLTSERRLEIAKTLNLNIDYELSHWEGGWILEKVIFDIKKFAEKLGNPDLMPLQKELAKHGRQDLRGAIGKFGGQSKVADLAGLIYQGQIVSPDGSRRYWTDERIGKFLHEVANKEGHPGVMPTTSAVKRHAGRSAKTIVAIFTRTASSWYDLAKRHGLQYRKGKHAVTQGFIKSFVKSLGDAIYHLTPAEIYVLFEQYGISKTGNSSRQGRSFDNLIDAIQRGCLPKHELENWTDGKRSALIDSLLDKDIKTVEEAFQNAGKKLQKAEHKESASDKDNVPYREDVENQLPTPTAGNILSSLKISTDILDQASSDEEAVEFLIAKATDKLWKKCFHDEESTVSKAKKHQGNLYSESARDAFIEEYSRCRQLPIPEGYSFSDPAGLECQPKLMQRLIAYRVLQRDRVLNLSGTGTGKTLSAILASRVIGAKLTIITCPNAIVETWRNNILNAFPQSEVITKPANWAVDWETQNIPRYLVINHEMLQSKNEAAIKRFISNNPYDLVVIDELQQVKQRDIRNESQRRRLLTGIITDIPEGRPNPRVLGMTATPIINNLQEGKSLVELVTSSAHDDIDTKHNIQNCMKMYRRFTALGFRMLPKSEVSREPQIYPVDATPLLDKLMSLGSRPHPQKVESVLLRAKWPIIRNHLKKKTVIFTEYVQGIVLELAELISQAGFTVGIHTGQEKLSTEPEYHDSLQQFMEGNTDVLIASIKTLATGVDGLQYVSNNVIFASLPWTSTDYDQAVGRFDREGMAFDKLDICIPKTYVNLNTGKKWSWCDSKLKRLENKRDISKAAVDGEIPDPESQLTPEKATQYWMAWLRRLNES